jgi:hypothetical protein
MDYENLSGPDGTTDNMGGILQKVYAAPIRYFDSIKKVATSPTTLAGLVDITDTHTFLTDMGFHKFYCTQDKGMVDAEPQGDRDGRSYKQDAKFFYPGSDSELHGFASMAKNDRFIFLAPMVDGTLMQIGTEDFPAEILGKFTTATNSGGVRGYEFTVSSMGPRNYIYKGTVTEFEPGS